MTINIEELFTLKEEADKAKAAYDNAVVQAKKELEAGKHSTDSGTLEITPVKGAVDWSKVEKVYPHGDSPDYYSLQLDTKAITKAVAANELDTYRKAGTLSLKLTKNKD